ncbi:hypothetical protein BGZ94_009256 [Podila epigama]|nr:hypothetical protein BGZ94_009256 [Podila epigama]
MLSKKKTKGRSRQRSPSSRAFEAEEEDMVIISRLENEPWQPDLLLVRQSGPADSSTSDTPGQSTEATTDHNLIHDSSTSSQGPVGFQGVIPVIIKSPSSVITTADSDCAASVVDSIVEDPTVKRPGIQEYLQQTHWEQQLLQRQLPQYQLPPHLQRQQNRNQYRNSFHGHTTVSPLLPHLRDDEHEHGNSIFLPRPSSSYEDQRDTATHSSIDTTHLQSSKTMTDAEEVIESLQSLKNLAMLALDGLLQQVVSEVTASDPVFNPDETTLQARALIRRRSGGNLLDMASEPETETFRDAIKETKATTTAATAIGTTAMTVQGTAKTSTASTNPYQYLANGAISGMAASSLERLDELTRKVDQLAVVVTDDNSPFGVLHEPANIPERTHIITTTNTSTTAATEQRTSTARVVDANQVFESQEYQLACALAAMLACTYRILNQMEEPRVPLRTESADSGMDQASRLWKRLSSNSFSRRPTTMSGGSHPTRQKLTNSLPSSPEKKQQTASPGASAAHSGTGGFIQSINRQVRTLRSRRTQSTSHIEVPISVDGSNKRSSTHRLLGGLSFGPIANSSQRSLSLLPEDAAAAARASELEREWAELDKLMEEMSHLWQLLECTNVKTDDTVSQQQQGRGLHSEMIVTTTVEDHLVQPTTTTTTRSPNLSMVTASSNEKSSAVYDFDQQTLDMVASGEDLPQYDDHFRGDAPQYRFDSEKQPESYSSLEEARMSNQQRHQQHHHQQRRGFTSVSGAERMVGSGPDDEKTRYDLNNVMSAIERLSKVAPRLDDQRVQLSAQQKRAMAGANVAHAIERLSRGRWENQRATLSTATTTTTTTSTAHKKLSGEGSSGTGTVAEASMERTRDLNKLVNQIVESAKASYTNQKAEFSPRQQWKLEGSRIGDKIERSERLRMSDQDWESPEKVLLKDMTRLTNALYQQSATSQAFATQRFTLTEDKARNMALQGIISKIERLSDRRMDNQDALPPSTLSASSTTLTKNRTTTVTAGGTLNETETESAAARAKELQDMINQMVESGGGPTRRSAMSSQRAEFKAKSEL